ncbi:MAG: HypC/HybG/HupF family hydrogenase formation chaperone [Anaerolineae bacterium]
MCLAIPLKVISVQGTMATVEMGGISREISLVLTPEAQAGNYVLVHTGFAISVLDETEAQETLALFAELEEAERQLDDTETRQRQL